jgi:hypothetical protein
MADDLKDVEIVKRWPIEPEYRQAMIEKLAAIISSPSSSTKEVTDASRALLAAERQNQQDEADVKDDFTTELIRLASNFGIDVQAITDQRPASEDPA